jgi:hypothetical protein
VKASWGVFVLVASAENAGMTSIERLARLASDLGEIPFVEMFSRPALVFGAVTVDPRTGRVETPSSCFSTSHSLEKKVRIDSRTHVVRPLVRDLEEGPTPRRSPTLSSEPTEEGPAEVVFLQKSDRNPFVHMITVGRAMNNDVVLADSTVSKVHAYFTSTPGGWVLTDQHSTNGTYVEGKPLPDGGSAPLADGVVVRFGAEARATFFTPAQLYRFVARPRQETAR